MQDKKGQANERKILVYLLTFKVKDTTGGKFFRHTTCCTITLVIDSQESAVSKTSPAESQSLLSDCNGWKIGWYRHLLESLVEFFCLFLVVSALQIVNPERFR